ncbi:hypothetical protein PRUPE_1G319100 [Prunus persica]|uniref:Wall-associated receptor kinase galacturonan-binding domain-containing protein n=1 Tax=Prunus persica TaxID=3760 RepID=A0A251R693_PRUPE|nr:uncharacterized protein LOC18790770 [Prunus persica]ONI31543.1 hypothetical protein PRUPE_1G319100 [Prunus persica]
MTRATSTASSVLYSVLLIFLCFVRVQVQARYHKQANCSRSCGEIQNIKYPFRLKGDPSGCGDPDYEFSCVDDRTILEIFPGKFYVHNISYNDQILRLVDVNFANGSCSLPSGSVLSADRDVKDSRFGGFVNSSRSLFRFMKCSKNISSLQTAANYTRVPCLTTNGSYLYAIYDRDYYYHRQPQPSCSLISVAPVDFDQDIKFPSYEAIMELLQAGFDVGWSVECRDCSLAGKGCLVSSWDQPITYVCSREYKEPTSLQIILILVGIGIGALVGLFFIILILVVVIRKYRRGRRKAAKKKLQNQQCLTPTISNSGTN